MEKRRTFAGRHRSTGHVGYVAVETTPTSLTHALILIAALNACGTVEARVAIGRTPVDEALASRPGKPRLTRTVERGRRTETLGAASVVQARV